MCTKHLSGLLAKVSCITGEPCFLLMSLSDLHIEAAQASVPLDTFLRRGDIKMPVSHVSASAQMLLAGRKYTPKYEACSLSRGTFELYTSGKDVTSMPFGLLSWSCVGSAWLDPGPGWLRREGAVAVSDQAAKFGSYRAASHSGSPTSIRKSTSMKTNNFSDRSKLGRARGFRDYAAGPTDFCHWCVRKKNRTEPKTTRSS